MLCIEITRFNKLTQIKPNGDPVNPQDLIKNQNILTRFASEFDMMNEMIQFQKGALVYFSAQSHFFTPNVL